MAAGMFADPSKMQNTGGMPAPAHWLVIPSLNPAAGIASCALLELRLQEGPVLRIRIPERVLTVS